MVRIKHIVVAILLALVAAAGITLVATRGGNAFISHVEFSTNATPVNKATGNATPSERNVKLSISSGVTRQFSALAPWLVGATALAMVVTPVVAFVAIQPPVPAPARIRHRD
ncbi:hypothetical protein [Lacticaseibacillus thailandensis]|uniref:Uncharacterized protein n=1 Tax=Lacticaseibacillus thailandensis DSM 22698 = JCM 13996 TaxID=1423810 RepID=A0A0R2CIB9_9LACO|nr:hypothetical protein [Lacticaseibacillus thailandensis]KRM88171.1 hypothetical protein FD19_GL000461 [Lacticaseibacillus thailandensis DSM 22698 = JCM 13996]